MGYLNATSRDLLGGPSAWVDFGDFKTEIILARHGRTEANQLICFRRDEVGCIQGFELTDEHRIVVPLSEGCIWGEVWLSIFGSSIRHVRALTATLFDGRE